MKRIKVTERIADRYDIDFEYKTLTEVVAKLQGIVAEYSGLGFTNIRFDTEYDRYESQSPYTVVVGDRLENDKEFEKRKKKIAKEKEAKRIAAITKEEQDRKEYERLKKKFG